LNTWFWKGSLLLQLFRQNSWSKAAKRNWYLNFLRNTRGRRKGRRKDKANELIPPTKSDQLRWYVLNTITFNKHEIMRMWKKEKEKVF
jgi:hypothetical protein